MAHSIKCRSRVQNTLRSSESDQRRPRETARWKTANPLGAGAGNLDEIFAGDYEGARGRLTLSREERARKTSREKTDKKTHKTHAGFTYAEIEATFNEESVRRQGPTDRLAIPLGSYESG